MDDVSIRLKKKRKLMGLTQAQLANLLGVKPQTISGWERGLSHPKGAQLSSLSKAFNVPKSWILYGNDELANSGSSSCDLIVKIPLYENIQTGVGNSFDLSRNFYPMPSDVIENQENKDSIFCIKVYGNSMEPAFYDGAVLAVNGSRKSVIDGRVYVFRINNRLRVKAIKETHIGIDTNELQLKL
ncbi:XRE family transcriptional regulator [Photobacterium leiognathi]|uniref:XRE family transcriptional regulator n=1 Tax=Photobacterium leiognathi TaxID=553611 RepID=UPI00273A301B|nr:XRE family transcriptional regulator [Photobacterium leiognathi]